MFSTENIFLSKYIEIAYAFLNLDGEDALV